MIKKITVEPYGRKLWLVWGETESSLRACLAKEDDDYSPAYKLSSDSKGVTVTTARGHVVIRFHEEPHSHGLIAHEAFHAAFGILDRLGVELVPQSEEALAYLLDWLVEKIYEAKKEASVREALPLTEAVN